MEAGTSAYMLLFRGTEWSKGLSPEELQNVTTQWMGWFDSLCAQGIAKAGNPLELAGKVVRGGSGSPVVADGPFAESKETVGGYFLIEVAGMDEALEVARQCPGLPYGAVVEVRPVAARCPLSCGAGQDAAATQLAGTTA